MPRLIANGQCQQSVYVRTVLCLRFQITRLAKLVTQIRSIKSQLAAKKDLWKDQSQAQSLLTLGKDLSAKLDKLEGQLHNANAKIPYDLLLTVLYTAGQAELENYRFVVLQKGEGSEG